MQRQWDLEQVPAYGETIGEGLIRVEPEDFQVTEKLSFTPGGGGEHLYLFIEKTNANTEWVIKELARNLGVNKKDIGYAGLKDRHAVTRQWLSIYSPGAKPFDFNTLPENIKVLQHCRAAKN